MVAVVVTEAHCVSKWSKDFRPTYGRLHELRALVHGLHSQATRSVHENVTSGLNMKGCEIVCTLPDRKRGA